MHSNEGSGPTRLYGLEMSLALSGRFQVCYQSSRKQIIGAYPPC